MLGQAKRPPIPSPKEASQTPRMEPRRPPPLSAPLPDPFARKSEAVEPPLTEASLSRPPGRVQRKALASAEGARHGHTKCNDNAASLAAHSPSARTIPFPHGSQIRTALKVSEPLLAVHDPKGCQDRGVPAFTAGTTAHFSDPAAPLDVAAHEATHVLQHRGATRDAGLGAEGHAIAVERAVANGTHGSPLVGGRGQAIESAVRDYTTSGGKWLVGETRETLTMGGQEAYATPSLISSAAGILKAKRSKVQLSVGAARKFPLDDGTEIYLSRINVRFPDVDPKSEEFYSDCREAAQAVAGAEGKDKERVLCQPGAPITAPFQAAPRDAPGFIAYLDEQIAQSRQSYDKMTIQEKQQFAIRAHEQFMKLPQEKKDHYAKLGLRYAKELGADRYADAQPGEAFVAVRAEAPGKDEPRFHFATVIMSAGPDRITLENSGGEPGEKSKRWSIQTYGVPTPDNPRFGQTFHESNPLGGGVPIRTVVGRFMPEPPSYLKDIPTMPTRELLSRHASATDEGERFYLRRELELRRINAQVTVISTEDILGSDDVYLVFRGSAQKSTPTQSLNDGETGSYSVALSEVLSAAGKITVELWEYDIFDPNDFIGTISIVDPYAPVSLTVRGDDATYDVSVTVT